MNVLQKITEILAEHTGGDASKITWATTFEELEVDSLDIVEIVMKFEEELGVELELDEQFATIGELAAFIETKLKP